MYRAGVCSILSQLAREERLAVVEKFTLDSPKTKLLAAKLKGMGLDDVLIITDSIDENLLLSSRNLPNVARRDGEPCRSAVPDAARQRAGDEGRDGQDSRSC